MTIYYSAESNAFYDASIHGALTIQVPDPSWQPTEDQTEADRPLIEQPNPDCKIPDDAMEITKELHQKLLEAQSDGKLIQAKSDGTPEAVDRPLTPIAERRKQAQDAIDAAAGNARQRYVSKGQLVEEEYRLAKTQTEQWRANGSPSDAVPATIQAWADAMGADNETAAQDIEATAAGWEQVIEGIRQIRLSGKSAVNNATAQGTENDMADVAKPFIDQLDAMQP